MAGSSGGIQPLRLAAICPPAYTCQVLVAVPTGAARGHWWFAWPCCSVTLGLPDGLPAPLGPEGYWAPRSRPTSWAELRPRASLQKSCRRWRLLYQTLTLFYGLPYRLLPVLSRAAIGAHVALCPPPRPDPAAKADQHPPRPWAEQLFMDSVPASSSSACGDACSAREERTSTPGRPTRIPRSGP